MLRGWFLSGLVPCSLALIGSARSDNEIMLDLAKGIASGSGWQADIADCSAGALRCIEVEGHFVLAMPARCGDATGALDLGSGDRFRQVAPAPHLLPPSGSYISTKYPKALVFYDNRQGFFELRLLRHSPFEQAFDPNDVDQRFTLEAASGEPLFPCM